MTESEWLTCTRLEPMQQFLAGKHTERQCRLFEIACLRNLFWHLLTDSRSRAAIDVAERHADGDVTPAEVREACDAATAAFEEVRARYFDDPNRPRLSAESFYGGAVSAAQHVSLLLVDWRTGTFTAMGRPTKAFNPYQTVNSFWWAITAAYPLSDEPEDESQWDESREAGHEKMREAEAEAAPFVRDLFGNVFHPGLRLERGWLDWQGGVVLQLARAIYDGRDFDRLPMLADALQDAGCDESRLLGHLRAPGPHVRGCWALDFLLGQEGNRLSNHS